MYEQVIVFPSLVARSVWELFQIYMASNERLEFTERERQNAELCRNISCFVEFRQNWLKPETGRIFGKAAILWSPDDECSKSVSSL